MEEWKEFSAKTADEALTNALIQMETTSDQIEYEVCLVNRQLSAFAKKKM